MSIEKKSLISTLKTAKKANSVKDNFEVSPAAGKMATRKLPSRKTATAKFASRKTASLKITSKKM